MKVHIAPNFSDQMPVSLRLEIVNSSPARSYFRCFWLVHVALCHCIPAATVLLSLPQVPVTNRNHESRLLPLYSTLVLRYGVQFKAGERIRSK